MSECTGIAKSKRNTYNVLALISIVVCRTSPSVLFLLVDYDRDYDSTKRPHIEGEYANLGTRLHPEALLSVLLVPVIYLSVRR